MKKRIFSLLLSLLLCFSLACTALAADDSDNTASTGFDATVTVDRTNEENGSFTVTVVSSTDNDAILAEKAPTLSVTCSYTNTKVTDPGGKEIDSTIIAIADGKISFPVTKGGTYTITETFTVTFEAGRGISVEAQTVARGETASAPTVPTRYGYSFCGWYTDEKCTTAYDFTTPITADITLYAKWTYIPVYAPSTESSSTMTNPDGSVTKTTTDSVTGTVTESTTYPNGVKAVTVTTADGEITAAVSLPASVENAVVTIPVADATAGTVAVIVRADGTEEIVQTCVVTEDGVALIVEDDVQLKIVDNSKVFADVSGQWFQTAVDFVSARGIITGNTPTTFGPGIPTTRAMIWTMLARLSGVDTTVGETWWSIGQQWAMENEISDGSMPDQVITREQLVTMLYRYAQLKGMDVSVGEDTNILSYNDAFEVSEWAIPAMQWACGSGVVQGDGINLMPATTASRSEVAQILMNFCKHLVL